MGSGERAGGDAVGVSRASLPPSCPQGAAELPHQEVNELATKRGHNMHKTELVA